MPRARECDGMPKAAGQRHSTIQRGDLPDCESSKTAGSSDQSQTLEISVTGIDTKRCAGKSMIGAPTDESLRGDRIALGTPFRPVSVPATRGFAGNTKWLFVLFLLALPLVNPWVRGDGVGYYAYLRSMLIDHNLRFENDYLAGNSSFLLSVVDADGHLRRDVYTPTGYVENHFSVGPAILWAPVMIVVHGAVVLVDHFGAHIAADGRSRPYLIAMAMTTAAYGFLSLILAFQIARKYFDSQWAFFATLGIWLASSLPVYMYFNPSWSHALSAFAVSLFLWYWDRTQLRRTPGQWAILGVLAGLMGNVYYPNAILLVFPGIEVFYLLFSKQTDSNKERAAGLKILACCALFGAVFLFSLLPTFITRQIIYGSPFATGYPRMGMWHWTSPALLKVLFSSDHGMFTWTPILALAAVGLIFLCKRNPLLGAGSVLAFLGYYYFIASYNDWDGLSSFGNRFFVSLTPIFILGLTALFSSIASWVGNPSRAAILSATAVVLFTAWNMGFIFQWGTHMVPARGQISWGEMVHNQFDAVPLRITHSLKTYFLNRRDMMQHIEQQDLDQQKSQGLIGN